MTTKKTSRTTRTNHYRNNYSRRIAWDDLRAMAPLDPHTDYRKPPVGYYILDEDGNYPENIREVY